MALGKKKEMYLPQIDPLMENKKELDNVKKRLLALENNQLKMEQEMDKREQKAKKNNKRI